MLQSGKVDWSSAESLAIGTLLSEGFSVRLSGQDSGRGTFSQRHAVLRNQDNHDRYIPLNNIQSGQKKFEVIDRKFRGTNFIYTLKTPSNLLIPVFVHSHHIHQHEENEKFGIKRPIHIDHIVCF